MRLHFTLSANTIPVEFNYQHRLTGAFHKWLGENDLHDRISLYSLSWLDGGRVTARGFDFPGGARWFVSFYEDEHAEKLVNGALAKPELFCGLSIHSVRQQVTPSFGTHHRFFVGSPILAKGKTDEAGKVRHYLYDDTEADEIITATLRRKMDEANERAAKTVFTPEHKQVSVKFDREFRRPKTKLVDIKGIKVRASVCPVIIEGAPAAVQFAWNVGVGNNTGSSLGSLI